MPPPQCAEETPIRAVFPRRREALGGTVPGSTQEIVISGLGSRAAGPVGGVLLYLSRRGPCLPGSVSAFAIIGLNCAGGQVRQTAGIQRDQGVDPQDVCS